MKDLIVESDISEKEKNIKRSKKYWKTKKGVLNRIYFSQISNSKRRNHKMPSYTLEELRKWAFEQDIFHLLFNEWVISGYKTPKKPSVDRLDDKKHYFFGNIRIVSWSENFLKEVNFNKICVSKFTKNNEFICKYDSALEAFKDTKISNSNILMCCKGKRKTAGGFKWKIS